MLVNSQDPDAEESDRLPGTMFSTLIRSEPGEDDDDDDEDGEEEEQTDARLNNEDHEATTVSPTTPATEASTASSNLTGEPTEGLLLWPSLHWVVLMSSPIGIGTVL